MDTFLIFLGNLNNKEMENKLLKLAHESGNYQAVLEAILGISSPASELNESFSNVYLAAKVILN